LFDRGAYLGIFGGRACDPVWNSVLLVWLRHRSREDPIRAQSSLPLDCVDKGILWTCSPISLLVMHDGHRKVVRKTARRQQGTSERLLLRQFSTRRSEQKHLCQANCAFYLEV
jgi:hypothetical protein